MSVQVQGTDCRLANVWSLGIPGNLSQNKKPSYSVKQEWENTCFKAQYSCIQSISIGTGQVLDKYKLISGWWWLMLHWGGPRAEKHWGFATDWICAAPASCDEIPALEKMVWGDGVSGADRVMSVERALKKQWLVPLLLPSCVDMEKMGIYEPVNRPSLDCILNGDVILDFQLPKLWEIHFFRL